MSTHCQRRNKRVEVVASKKFRPATVCACVCVCVVSDWIREFTVTKSKSALEHVHEKCIKRQGAPLADSVREEKIRATVP